MEDFDQMIFTQIKEYAMIRPHETVLAAVSGGADSVCLLVLLSKLSASYPFQLRAVHVEHGIRGEESREDCAFVRDLCKGMEVPLTVRAIRAAELAAISGRSLEEEARIQRYRIFREIAEETGAARVAVAHHMGDQAETVLWNLIRGTGSRGLAGIRPVRALGETCTVIRPLLGADRRQIEAYLAACGIPFRTDRTNLDPTITRNRIRLKILPELEKLNRRAGRHIARAARQVGEEAAFLDRLADQAAETCTEGFPGADREAGSIRLAPFLAEDPVIRRRILRTCLGKVCGEEGLKDLGWTHIEDLMGLALQDCGKSLSLPGGLEAVREADRLVFLSRRQVPEKQGHPERSLGLGASAEAGAGTEDTASEREKPAVSFEVPFAGEMTLRAGGRRIRMTCCRAEEKMGLPPGGLFTKWVAYDTMSRNQTHTLCLRTRRPGDYLVIREDGSRKKLADYLIDEKVPRRLRDEVPLLADGHHILWVIGGRISEAAKVSAGRPYLRIEAEAEDERDGHDINSPGKG